MTKHDRQTIIPRRNPLKPKKNSFSYIYESISTAELRGNGVSHFNFNNVTRVKWWYEDTGKRTSYKKNRK
jgi:hypothetical protein